MHKIRNMEEKTAQTSVVHEQNVAAIISHENRILYESFWRARCTSKEKNDNIKIRLLQQMCYSFCVKDLEMRDGFTFASYHYNVHIFGRCQRTWYYRMHMCNGQFSPKFPICGLSLFIHSAEKNSFEKKKNKQNVLSLTCKRKMSIFVHLKIEDGGKR